VSITLYQVDAFTEEPFQGNPAAVCILEKPADADWMQLVAREMNLSETAFLHPQGDGFNLRWFTPATEVDLCGHATLAAAHVLWETHQVPPEARIVFTTRSGRLEACLKAGWIELDFPATPVDPVAEAPILLRALGTAALFVGRNRFDYLVEVADEGRVNALVPNFDLLRKIDARGVMVTAQTASSGLYDFVSRFFAPAAGVNEDPVTGSAHCSLGPYWSRKLGKTELYAYQASARGGALKVSVQEDRVLLGGKALTVMVGALFF
jgi:PhzF family phenazine biosynthesis protein